jgi:N4-gp56 family major capsid protein
MAQIQGTGGASGSTIGKQFNDKFWSKVAVTEAKKQKVFSQLGDKLTQPKHYGDTIVKYHEIPILHASNINDQGIDANGVKMATGVWYAYAADGSRITTGADADGSEGFSTKALALAAPGMATIKSGDGNLYGGSKDIVVQNGAFPSLAEEGGAVNQVGMKRLDLEAKVEEFGFALTFTKKSLEQDTEKGLLARYSRGIGEAQGDLREAQIRNHLLSTGMNNKVYAGVATTMGGDTGLDSADKIVFSDLRKMDQALKDARCPKDTKLINGSTKVGTTTVPKARYVYVGPDMIPTLEDMTITVGSEEKLVWNDVAEYADAGTIADGEIGRIGQFRFIEVEEMPVYEGQGADSTVAGTGNIANDDGNTVIAANGNYNVYPILFVGSGSFATVGFEGDVARVTTVMPKADAHNDFYGKKGVVSISWYFGIMDLRPEWIRVILTTAKEA